MESPSIFDSNESPIVSKNVGLQEEKEEAASCDNKEKSFVTYIKI